MVHCTDTQAVRFQIIREGIRVSSHTNHSMGLQAISVDLNHLTKGYDIRNTTRKDKRPGKKRKVHQNSRSTAMAMHWIL
jgi:hypothetical protein